MDLNEVRGFPAVSGPAYHKTTLGFAKRRQVRRKRGRQLAFTPTMASATHLELSRNDARVFEALFSSEGSPTEAPYVDTSTLSLPGIAKSEYLRLHKAQSESLKAINVPNPEIAAVQNVIDTLSEILRQQPAFAPAYANRAQATRLLINDEEIFNLTNKIYLEAIVEDLERAIDQASPTTPNEALSQIRAHILATSYTHLAYLLLLASRTNDAEVPGKFKPTGGKTAEDMASEMFRLGGLYGNKIAQEMAVKTNPYAKLCGEMVKEALKEDMRAAGVQE